MFVAKLGKLVKVVQPSPPRNSSARNPKLSVTLPPAPESDTEDEDASDEEDCPLIPEVGYKFVWKRDSQGRKYFVPKKEKRNIVGNSPIYVYDKVTGRTYMEKAASTMNSVKRKPLPKQKGLGTAANMMQLPAFVDHRQAGCLDGMPATTRSYPRSVERMPSLITADTERQGRETKVPEIVQWARDCPVS